MQGLSIASGYNGQPVEFDFDDFRQDNTFVEVKQGTLADTDRVFASEYLSFELEKECDALEVMINKLRSENQLLHEIPQLNLKDSKILESVVADLSEYSLSWSNQSLVLNLACSILKELSDIPANTQNEARNQCIEYQASKVDVGKTSSLQESDVWRNTVWTEDDFVTQDRFDISVLKENLISDNHPRTLYADLRNKTLTIHDPSEKGKLKVDKILNEDLIHSLNYRSDVEKGFDHMSMQYYPSRQGRGKKKVFNAWLDPYEGRQFIALTSTYIAPARVGEIYRLGNQEGPFSQYGRLRPIPQKFPKTLLLTLLQQQYVEAALMEKWSYATDDSSSWLTDSNITTYHKLTPRSTTKLENLLKAFITFLRFEGFELVSFDMETMKAQARKRGRKSRKSTKAHLRRGISYHGNNKKTSVKTVRTNWLDSKLEQLTIPHIVSSLVPALAEFLHNQWLREKTLEHWKYGTHHSFDDKLSIFFFCFVLFRRNDFFGILDCFVIIEIVIVILFETELILGYVNGNSYLQQVEM